MNVGTKVGLKTKTYATPRERLPGRPYGWNVLFNKNTVGTVLSVQDDIALVETVCETTPVTIPVHVSNLRTL